MKVFPTIFLRPVTSRSKPSITFMGPVVGSIISLTSPLRGQLVKCFRDTLIFFVEKLREAFAMQKLPTVHQKVLARFRYYGSLPKTSNNLNIRTPKIIAKYNFEMFPKISSSG